MSLHTFDVRVPVEARLLLVLKQKIGWLRGGSVKGRGETSATRCEIMKAHNRPKWTYSHVSDSVHSLARLISVSMADNSSSIPVLRALARSPPTLDVLALLLLSFRPSLLLLGQLLYFLLLFRTRLADQITLRSV